MKMKAILMNIKPEWCEKIFNGAKTIEVRKTAPKLKPPFKVYVYQTKNRRGNKVVNEALDAVYGGGKVVGEFVCDNIGKITMWNDCIVGFNRIMTLHETLLSVAEMLEYMGNRDNVVGWHINDPKRYDIPKELSEFLTPSGTGGGWENHYICRVPRSWCYVEEIEE